ncbi:MAG: FtsW/RodA/SpoVE family cell cycle protein [Phycisphaerales bacterium]|nr:FtsW/RodA/SpoVE family cell cycle protein [Phycisphaerales bacterium]
MAPRDVVLIVATALLALGAVAVQSAGMTVTQSGTVADLATNRTTLLAIAAVAALLLGRSIPVAWTTSRTVAVTSIVVAGVLLAFVLVPGIGSKVNGARRWINFGPIGFQPSELAKWALLLFLAWYGATRVRHMGQFRRGLLPALAVVGLLCGLILLEDLGTAVLIGTVATIMLIAAGARLKHMIMLAVPAAAALFVAIAVEPYRLKRLQIFLDPWADPEGKGYHVIQSMAAIHGGGIGGRGLGNGIQKFGYLPEDTTDFIFSIITEEFGLLGATLVVGLFIALLWAGWRIVTSQVRPERQLLALGIVAMISLQTLMNLLVVTGLAPTKGIALPLVSSGGTGWVMTAFMLGVLARLDPTAPAASTLPNEPIPEVVP